MLTLDFTGIYLKFLITTRRNPIFKILKIGIFNYIDLALSAGRRLKYF